MQEILIKTTSILETDFFFLGFVSRSAGCGCTLSFWALMRGWAAGEFLGLMHLQSIWKFGNDGSMNKYEDMLKLIWREWEMTLEPKLETIPENLKPLVPFHRQLPGTNGLLWVRVVFLVVVCGWFFFLELRLISLVAADPMMISNDPLENTGSLASLKRWRKGPGGMHGVFLLACRLQPWGYQVLYFDMIYTLMSAGCPRTRHFCHGDVHLEHFFCGLFLKVYIVGRSWHFFQFRRLGLPRWCTIHLWQVWSSLVCQGVVSGSKCESLQVILSLQCDKITKPQVV